MSSPTPTAAAPKVPKTYAVTLSGGDREQMRVIAVVQKTGVTAFAQAITRNKEGKVQDSQRGADARFDSLAEATTYVDKLVAEFLKKGWVKRVGGGGGARSKPPAFDLKTLPAPKSKK